MPFLTPVPLVPVATDVTVNMQSDGVHATLSNPDGTVVSIQPDGSRQTRPQGTAGPWEVCEISGALAIFRPVPGVVWFYGFSQ